MRKKRRLKWQVYLIIFIISIFLLPLTFSKFKATFNNNINLSITKPTYTVKFDSNGGTGNMSDISCKYGSAQTLPSNTFVNEDKMFLGWNTEQNGSGQNYRDNEEIMYLSSIDGGVITLFAQWFDSSYLDDTTKLNDYICTESVETFTANSDGYYLLEAWGAQGGSVPENINGSKTLEAIEGGKGGYSYGIVYLNKDDEIYVVVGCEGKTLMNSVKGTTLEGGYNGGGQALLDVIKNYQGSGGGATHFATNNLGELKNFENNKSDVLLVAGGGGGSYSSTEINYYSVGGFGGGQLGGSAFVYYKYRTSPLINGSYVYYYGLEIPGASQLSQSDTNMYIYGTFGKGADAIRSYSGADAGAGGGWYGGNKLANNSSMGSVGGMAGSGGSGYVNTSTLINGQTIAGNMSIPTHDGSSYMTGNTGDGYAKISYVKPHYTVKFNANGGTGTMSDMDFAYNESKALTNNSFTRTSCIFKKWNTSADGTGNNYTDHQTVSGLSSDYDAVIDLYAIWDCNIYIQLPPDWTSSEDVHVYLYDSNGVNSSNYSFDSPTNDYKATKIDNDKKIFKYTVLAGENIFYYDKVVFNNINMRKTIDVDLATSNIGQIFAPELYSGSGTRVFYVVAADPHGSNNWIPFVHKWNSSSSTTWPGDHLTASDKVSDITYKAVIEAGYTNVIFNNGKKNVDQPADNLFQTDSLSVPAYQDLTLKNNSFFRRFYAGSWHDYSTWTSTEYNTWYTDHYSKFVAAQSALGY